MGLIRNFYKAFALLSVLFLASCLSGCSRTDSNQSQDQEAPVSGGEFGFYAKYSSGPNDWMTFLSCWREEVARRVGGKSADSPGGGVEPVRENMVAQDLNGGAMAIQKAEARLGIKLPKSYKDFLLATSAKGWKIESFLDPVYGWEGQGLYDLERIGLYSATDPENYSIWARDSKNEWASDSEYYRYGHAADPEKRQQSTTFRGRYLDRVIKIGGVLQGGAILLNPSVISVDGEMEVWLLTFKAFLSRYRSFAEFMQVMAYNDIVDGGYRVPPVAELNNISCIRNLNTALLLGGRPCRTPPSPARS